MTVQVSIPVPILLGAMPMRVRGTIAQVDWDALTDSETRRLREFGLDEGVEVELLQRASFGKGPVAARIGRMSITFRSHIARAIRVTL